MVLKLCSKLAITIKIILPAESEATFINIKKVDLKRYVTQKRVKIFLELLKESLLACIVCSEQNSALQSQCSTVWLKSMLVKELLW